MVASALPLLSLESTRVLSSKRAHLATPTRSMQDDLLARAQAGDEDAFSKLYQQHKRRVLSICMNMVHNFSLAEDLVQETFLQVHRKLASFRAESAFTTWLHRITVNIVLMHLRKRALPVVSLDELMANVPGEHFGRGVAAHDLAQVGVIDRVAIDRAALKLAPGSRSIFLLHDVHGFQHKEIACMLDCTLGRSKTQLHKARHELRSVLATRTGGVRRNSNATSKFAKVENSY
jgi:RNA polymerase sigma-70 factor (ECF subfamily)